VERLPNFIFVHFVVFFLIFNTTKDLAMASPATQYGEEYEPRKTRKTRKKVEASTFLDSFLLTFFAPCKEIKRW